jgi:RNA polymerase primary sigma factor
MPTAKPMKPSNKKPQSAQSKAAAKPKAKAAPKAAAKPVSKPPVKAAAKPAAKPVAKAGVKPSAKPAAKSAKVEKPGKHAISVSSAKASKSSAPVNKASAKTVKSAPPDLPLKKAPPVPTKSSPESKPVAAVADVPVKKKPGRPPKNPAAEGSAPAATGAKRGRKPKNAASPGSKPGEDLDMSDIEDDLVGEPVAETTEKVKPLRMKISKAKERALMKEFGLDETVLSEEDMLKRRLRLKTLIKLGKTRGYLTHGEISDHLPDKLVDAETLEVVVNMLNDMGVAVYEQAPDAETLLLNNTGPTVATEEEAEEEAEAALSTVDSEFGRTTDPVRMYMREMGTVELLTREGEIEIAKRIEAAS